MPKIKIASIVFIVLSFVSVGKAQEKASPAQVNDKVEQLQKNLDEQEKRFQSLQETLQKQSEIIERQQKQIDSLHNKFEQKGSSSATVSTTSSQTANANTTSTQTAEVKPSPKPGNNVESGFGKIKFNGLIQGWYSAGNGTKNTFRFRRTEMKFSGQLLPKVKWTLMIDPTKALSLTKTTTLVNGVPVVTDVGINQSSRILQDAFFTLTYIKNVNVDIGQYKIPLTLEGLQSSATLDTVERALFMSDRSRGGGLGDIRDVGIQFSGPLGKSFNYQIGVFNGTGENQNNADTNQEKAVIGRFTVRPPFIKGLRLGVSGAWGNFNRITNPRRDRFGGELLYTNKKIKIKTEVMGAVDVDLHRLGYYTHFGYKITPKIEAIFRLDSFDPDRRRETNSANVFELDYVGGFNYYITENNFKFQFNYIRKTFNNGIVSPKNLFLANLQTSW